MLAFVLHLISLGFLTALEPLNVLLILFGVIGGLFFALLPGLNVAMIVILLVPLVYGMSTVHAISLLVGAYVGGVYGGAITAILYNIPGDSIHVPMLADGYNLTRMGRSGEAIGWTIGSFIIAGVAAGVVMFLFSGPLAHYSLRLSSPDYFSVIVFGLSSVVVVGAAQGATIPSSLISMGLGLLLGTVGVDPVYSYSRFTFGVHYLLGGIGFLPVMIGLYAIAEILSRVLDPSNHTIPRQTSSRSITLPRLADYVKRRGSLLRGIAIGTFIGIIPGAGATPAAFVAYGTESNYGRNRNLLGTGIPDGLICTQAAATASVGGALIPLFTLGIPGSITDAVILGALQLHDVYPSPIVFAKEPAVIYPIFAGVFIAIALTAIVTALSIRGMIAVLRIPPAVLAAFIMLFSLIGAYTLRSDIADVWVAVAASILALSLKWARIPIGPLLLGVILGPIAENNLIESLAMSSNHWSIFLQPVSAVFLGLSVLVFIVSVLSQRRRTELASAN